MGCEGGSGANVSVFRALRLLRVFKLLKNFHELRKLIEVILFAVSDTGYLNLIILLYLFIAALMGMQFFGGRFSQPDGETPRANFNSFYASLLTVFQILTRDDWVNVMWNAMTASGEASAIYFLVLVVCGDFLILNLFLAILIQSFDENVDPQSDDDDEIAPPETETENGGGGRTLSDVSTLGRVMRPLHRWSASSMQSSPIAAQCSYRDLRRVSSNLVTLVNDAADRKLQKPALLQITQSFRTASGPLRARSLYASSSVPPPDVSTLRPTPSARQLRQLREPQHATLPALSAELQKHPSLCISTGGAASLSGAPSVTASGAASGAASGMTASGMVASGMAASGVATEMPSESACQQCGEPLLDVYHSSICHHTRLRKMREARLQMLQRTVAADRAAGVPASERLEVLLGLVWEVGLLLDISVEEVESQAARLAKHKQACAAVSPSRRRASGSPKSASSANSGRTSRGRRSRGSMSRLGPRSKMPRVALGASPPSACQTPDQQHQLPPLPPLPPLPQQQQQQQQQSLLLLPSSGAAQECCGMDEAKCPTLAVQGALQRRCAEMDRDLDTLRELATAATSPNNLWSDATRRGDRAATIMRDQEHLRASAEALDSWSCFAALLAQQQSVMALRVGEEPVGRAAQSMRDAARPTRVRTNGGHSLCLFGPTSWVRVHVYRLVKHPTFDAVILVCIMLSSLIMAVENPNPESDITGGNGVATQLLKTANFVFTIIFVTEMTLKLIAFGVLFGGSSPDPPYLRDSWNVMDGCIVVVSLLSLAFEGSDLAFLKVFRTFRALRPLRVIARNRGLRMVVSTLIQSIGSIGHVALISFLVFLVFGILGVQLLAGKLYHCTDQRVTHRDACVGWFIDCRQAAMLSAGASCWAPRKWQNMHSQHYDNVLASLLTLFEISTLEMWTVIMYRAIDAAGVDVTPRRDENPALGVFYVAFVTVGALFILNLFVGVVIHHYNDVKGKEDGLYFLTEEQKLWTDCQRMMLNFTPIAKMSPPKSRRMLRIYDFAQSDFFEVFIGACILLNVAAMSMERHDMDSNQELFVKIADWLFAFIFLCECLLKIAAFRMSYFRDPWNRFDFFLVMLSILNALLDSFRSSGLPVKSSLLRVMRIFRIMRILRLVKAARDVRILLETVWYSLPSIANIGGFLVLLFFIYAILGVNLFGMVRRGESGMGLTYHANFETFPNAALLLFRMVTGENWNAVMHDTMVTPPECGHNGTEDCGSPDTAPLYYISFLLLAAFVLINLFVAIILDNFATTMHIEKSNLRFNDLHRFLTIWSDFDPNATLTIPTRNLPKLLEQLGPPLGISRRTSRVEILKCNQLYSIPEHLGRIHFIETIIPLARQVMQANWKEFTDPVELREQEESWRQAFPDINELPVFRVRQKRATTDQYFAVAYIAAAYRRSLALTAAIHERHRRFMDSYLWVQERLSQQNPGWVHMKLLRRATVCLAKAISIEPRAIASLLSLPYDRALQVVKDLSKEFSDADRMSRRKRSAMVADRVAAAHRQRGSPDAAKRRGVVGYLLAAPQTPASDDDSSLYASRSERTRSQRRRRRTPPIHSSPPATLSLQSRTENGGSDASSVPSPVNGIDFTLKMEQTACPTTQTANGPTLQIEQPGDAPKLERPPPVLTVEGQPPVLQVEHPVLTVEGQPPVQAEQLADTTSAGPAVLPPSAMDAQLPVLTVDGATQPVLAVTGVNASC
eukprot:TRINITY_DN9431_c0_g1_i1.p1 TRINITY_DN9431_c0_g1~~TRINITY_DN9431_c0_g1_i1.p1  ORF type:complete len:1882 (+),score=565.62 TRINITY_DN9431_c0_g1_i1:528-5648(+)